MPVITNVFNEGYGSILREKTPASFVALLLRDSEGIYDPKFYNDRLLLGLKGTMSEAELYSLRQRLSAGRLSKVKRGEYVHHLPTGLERLPNQKAVKSPDSQVRQVIELVFAKFTELGSARQVMHYCRDHSILLPRYQTSGLYKGELLWKPPSEPAILSIVNKPAYAGTFVNRSAQRHSEVSPIYQQYTQVLLPQMVLVEVAYLIGRDAGILTVVKFWKGLSASRFEVIEAMPEDIARTADILTRYADSKVDFVDAVVMSMAKRLRIVTVLTIDQRDFSLFRPSHCSNFTLRP